MKQEDHDIYERNTKMKLRLWNLESYVNPLPVMSKEAFIAFARDWCSYAENLGLIGRIIIPGIKGYKDGKRGFFSIKGLWDFGYINGYLSKFTNPNPNIPTIDLTLDITPTIEILNKTLEYKDNYDYRNECGVDELVDAELSENFAFTHLIQPNTDNARKLKEKLEKQKLAISAEEMIETARKMVYERSALVRRGIFGGHYLTQ